MTLQPHQTFGGMNATPYVPKQDILDTIPDADRIVESKLVKKATLYYELDDGNIFIRYHMTDIVGFFPKKKYIKLDSGGWKTRTTMSRMNEYLPTGVRIFPKKGIWWMSDATGKDSRFYDGMTIRNNRPIAPMYHCSEDDNNLRMIKEFTRNLSKAKVFPTPDPGDCIYCHYRDMSSDDSIGDATGNVDHLKSHMEEEYINGSLLYNALQWNGYDNPILVLNMGQGMNIANSLRRYLKFKFNLPI